jgi:hypothetical protein
MLGLLVPAFVAQTSSHMAFINELHYDNSGADSGEFVELAGLAGTSLSGWQVVLYNQDGTTYGTSISLSGTLPDQQNGMGTLSFSTSGLQNGPSDALALVNAASAVVEFLSYEGTVTAAEGVASGQTSVDMGVAESSATPAGHSLQRTGSGREADSLMSQRLTSAVGGIRSIESPASRRLRGTDLLGTGLARASLSTLDCDDGSTGAPPLRENGAGAGGGAGAGAGLSSAAATCGAHTKSGGCERVFSLSMSMSMSLSLSMSLSTSMSKGRAPF